MRFPLLLSLALALTATGCPPAEEPIAAPTPQGSQADTTASLGGDAAASLAGDADAGAHPVPTEAVQGQVVNGVHEVACGCSLEAVGHCGEYAKVAGEFVEITGDLGLGDMPFCGKAGLKAEIEGMLHDGRLNAVRLKLVP